MNQEAEKKIIIKGLKLTSIHPSPTGGQNCGMMPTGVILTSEETGIKIAVSYYKSKIKNANFAKLLFELALNELIN